MKTKMQSMKTGRPSLGHLEINQWIREHKVRLGIGVTETPAVGVSVPTVTVYPSAHTIERLAHFGADQLIANNPAYAAACERTDAMLAEIMEGCSEKQAPSKPANRRLCRVPRVMVND